MAQETVPQEEVKSMLIIPQRQWLQLIEDVAALKSLINNDEDDKLMTIDELKKYFGVGRCTIYRYINDKGLQTRKVGGKTMFKKSDVERFIKEKQNV